MLNDRCSMVEIHCSNQTVVGFYDHKNLTQCNRFYLATSVLCPEVLINGYKARINIFLMIDHPTPIIQHRLPASSLELHPDQCSFHCSSDRSSVFIVWQIGNEAGGKLIVLFCFRMIVEGFVRFADGEIKRR